MTRPDHPGPHEHHTTQLPRIDDVHARPRRLQQQPKPVPLVSYLAVVVALAAITWGTWESGLHLSVKIVITGLCAALALLSGSSGIEVRRGKR